MSCSEKRVQQGMTCMFQDMVRYERLPVEARYPNKTPRAWPAPASPANRKVPSLTIIA